MTYRDVLDYFYRHLPMYQRIGPAAYKKDLTNTLALCANLGNPERQFAVIHVAGTNGKGSVSHMLAAACQAAGLRTGLYTSPHYRDLRERIKIDGAYMPRQSVVSFVARNRDAIEAIQPSFFELCVAMAFDHFARARVDVAIVEVGLGGATDSTNVVSPILSVITNISYDHMGQLGDTLEQIAVHKAGIIKPGVPAVVGETQAETASVFEEKAREMQAPLVFADQHFRASERAGASRLDRAAYDLFHDGQLIREKLTVEAGGPFQARNLATAAQAWAVLQHSLDDTRRSAWSLTDEAFYTGLARLKQLTRFQGRWQVLAESPTILADSAHNEAGLRSAFERILNLKFRCLHIVTGFVNDKDVKGVLPLFPRAARYYFAKADIPRGLPADELRERAAAQGLQGSAYASVRRALAAAKRAAEKDDLIVVIGSIFVVAEILPPPS